MAIIGWTFPPERRAGSDRGLVGVGRRRCRRRPGARRRTDRPLLVGIGLHHQPADRRVRPGRRRARPPQSPQSPQRRRLDPLGLGLSTLGLLGLSYGLIEGGHQGGWNRWQVWASIAVGLVLLAGFLFSEWREQQPSFDPRLFRNRRFAAGNFALAALFLTMTGQSFYLAFYLQGARGMSALSAGLMSLPGATGVVVGSPLGARLAARFGVAESRVRRSPRSHCATFSTSPSTSTPR